MKNDDGKGFDLLKNLGRYKFVLLIAVLGAVLMLWPSGEDSGESDIAAVQLSERDVDLRELEENMERILSKMHGVGRVDVMLTLQSGSELILATDSTLRYSGNPQNPNDYDRASETVTVSGGSGSDVVVTQEKYPQYRGALIVCDGGGSDNVRLRVVEAVSALTGLGTDRIAVACWGNDAVGTDVMKNSGEDLS